MSNFLDKWNKGKFSIYKSEEKTVLKLIENINNFVGDIALGLDQKTDVNGDHKGSWQGINRPTLSEEGLRGTVEKIVDNELPIIKNDLSAAKQNINETKENLNKNFNDLKYNQLNSSMGESDIENELIYQKDKLRLLGNTWAYYEGNDDYYPCVAMDKEGYLIFTGNAQVRSPLPIIEGLIEFGQLFHIDISKFEGIPLRGTFIGVADDDANNMGEIPFLIKTDGKIYLKNLGEGNKLYNRIDLNGARVKLNGFGNDMIHKNINSTIKKAQDLSIKSTQLIYFSDIHHDIDFNRRYEQLKAIKKVTKYLDIKAIISGGDNITEYPNKVKAIQCHRDLYGNFKKDKFIYCNGNHDLNSSNGSAYFVHPFNIKPYFNNTKVVWANDTKYYGYMDIEESGLRIVIFDSFETQFIEGVTPGASPNVSLEQIQWHINNSLNLLNTNINKIICVSHTPPTEKVVEEDTLLPTREIIRDTLRNFKNGKGDFSAQGKKDVVCWLFGHEHKDRVILEDGIYYIGNLLSAPIQVNYNEPGEEYKAYTREYGTEYEFAFDIISIVESERKVYFHRVGRKTVKGDRIISY